MKVLRKAVVGLLIVGMGSLTTGCFGSFQLTRNLYEWNDSVTSNKFLKTLLFYGLSIIPVYGVTVLLDFAIFNLIEFWGGNNPISMEEGDYEVEYHNYAGVNYKIEATQNQFKITRLDGVDQGKVTTMRFDTETETWFYEENDQSIALMSFEGDDSNTLLVYTQSGEIAKFDLTQNYSALEIQSKYQEAANFSTVAGK